MAEELLENYQEAIPDVSIHVRFLAFSVGLFRGYDGRGFKIHGPCFKINFDPEMAWFVSMTDGIMGGNPISKYIKSLRHSAGPLAVGGEAESKCCWRGWLGG